MGNSADSRVRAVRSYVLRHGRVTPAQQNAIYHYWSRWGLDPALGTIALPSLFPGARRVILEIGFGMGSSLLEMAGKEPESGFIGIEVHRPGVGRLLRALADQRIENVRVYCADAVDVLEQCLPAASLDAILLFFPDPWPKKRHHKRRIVQADFAQLVRSRLKLGGVFHMATDWPGYAEHMLATMESADGFANVNGERAFAAEPLPRPRTKFEQRGLALGHRIFDLLYLRTH